MAQYMSASPSEDNIQIWKQYTTYKEGDFVSQNKTYVVQEGHNRVKHLITQTGILLTTLKLACLKILQTKQVAQNSFMKLMILTQSKALTC